MRIPSIQIQNLSFTFDGATRPLFSHLSVHFPSGWTGVVGANGTGKSTLLKLATGRLHPQQGRVVRPATALYCRQRTDSAPAHLTALMVAATGDALEIRGRLGIQDDWHRRWDSLSHGERKRAQIAVALWRGPQALALDEPTNHLDLEAQDQIYSALLHFQGVGILVSHDRRLLDGLCRQCLMLEPPDAILRPGGYTQALQQAERERLAAHRRQRHAKQKLAKLKREATKRREAASQADRKRSKRGVTRRDHDTRSKIHLARLSGKDGAAGRRLRQIGGRLKQAQATLNDLRVKKRHTLGVWLPGATSRRNTLFQLPAGSLHLGSDRWLHYPELSMRPDDRIALSGPNGSGKSRLIDRIVRSLNVDADRLIFLPQEIDKQTARDILASARALSGERLGQLMTIVSRLGSRPRRLLESTTPSPGEIRKTLLAMGIIRTPHLIIMDEPTNHLDLPSISCLEAVLADAPCGLLLVSHDRRFLAALARHHWQIRTDPTASGEGRLVLP
ncbi:MAG: ATP-binding cassette domain-containing protein [Desulfosarcinaceae bacterium]|nr:ATP-binding cassette domain-containing protein [Desulfosarcinaceae bacterium]